MNKKTIINCILGNIIEWYDFGLFSIFSFTFSRLFFPNTDTKLSLIYTFGLFSIGFFARPLGALIFGYFGDTIGRAKTLRWSILMIAIPTLLIGFLPTYSSIGIAAPLLLILIRIWQGISVGGEYSGSIIYLAESAPFQLRATITAFASIGANVGILLAALIGTLTSSLLEQHTIDSWAWRIPYWISGVLSLLIYYFRLQLKETNVFKTVHKEIAVQNPLTFTLKNFWPQILRTLGMICVGTSFYYFSFVFLPVYLTQLKMVPTYTISKWMTVLMLIMIACTLLSGLLADYFGRRKMLLFNASIIAIIVIPAFYLLHLSDYIYPILILFGMMSGFEQGTTPTAIVENFPVAGRYTGVALAYNVGNGFIGGTVPLICNWLGIHSKLQLAPAFYISWWALISFMVLYFFVPKKKELKDYNVD